MTTNKDRARACMKLASRMTESDAAEMWEEALGEAESPPAEEKHGFPTCSHCGDPTEPIAATLSEYLNFRCMSCNKVTQQHRSFATEENTDG